MKNSIFKTYSQIKNPNLAMLLFTIISVIYSFTLISCSTPDNSIEAENIAHVKSMFDAFNQHDWKRMSEHYADSAQFLDPSFGTDYIYQSRDEMIKKYAEMEQMFPNINDNVLGIFAQGDKVSVEFISTGNAGDSISFSLPISCVLTLKNKLIVKDATYYNNCQE